MNTRYMALCCLSFLFLIPLSRVPAPEPMVPYEDVISRISLFGIDGRYWIEGRFTGGYHKTLYFKTNKGKVKIASYFEQVWFTFTYDARTDEIWEGEYWP